ncbi:hypothetical protein FE785_09325 [Thiomicrorhabdus sediminis]|uniref:SprA-related family protein n=2 Tax=Thiomicrorhabdus sediminis TaxID=2580412 RepID=A0A4P9K8A0_9GAMM|nr:hypothetical protein FE785_09325 [Thiomicrorhabdus sediminis]
MVGSSGFAQNKGNANQSTANTVNPTDSSAANFSNRGKAQAEQASVDADKQQPTAGQEENSAEQDKLEQVQQVVDQLKARDREVRAHEQAHMAAAGGYATGMSFSYQTGPDGKKYAVGGEVGIDTSKVAGNPEATIQKAMVIQRAAMAPAEPSSQDYKVARQASVMMTEARAELAEQDRNEKNEPAENLNENQTEPSSPSQRQPDQIVARGDNQDSGSMESLDRQQFNLRMQMPIQSLLVG